MALSKEVKDLEPLALSHQSNDDDIKNNCSGSTLTARDDEIMPSYSFLNPNWSINAAAQPPPKFESIEQIVNISSLRTTHPSNGKAAAKKKSSIQETLSSLKSSSAQKTEESPSKPQGSLMSDPVSNVLSSIKEDEEEMIQLVKAKIEQKKSLKQKSAVKKEVPPSAYRPVAKTSSLKKESVLSNSSIEAWKELEDMEELKKKHVHQVYESKRMIAERNKI
jgi:hypothetical protein